MLATSSPTWIAAALVCVTACGSSASKEQPQARVGRFDAVQSEVSPAASAAFCERSYPAQGPESRAWKVPPLRAMPEGTAQGSASAPTGTWRWINLWASWCGPCLQEFPLLANWQRSISAEGIKLDLELLSVDEDEAALVAAVKRGVPGSLSWLRSVDDLPNLLDELGVDRNAAIPIHALVDPQGQLRCVRVGSVHERDFGSIKAMIRK